MAPSFWRSFAPAFAAGLYNSYYGLAATHAVLGIASELLSLYTLAVAGTTIVPKRFQFTRYKPWMRTALAMWWLVLLLGTATYVRCMSNRCCSNEGSGSAPVPKEQNWHGPVLRQFHRAAAPIFLVAEEETL